MNETESLAAVLAALVNPEIPKQSSLRVAAPEITTSTEMVLEISQMSGRLTLWDLTAGEEPEIIATARIAA